MKLARKKCSKKLSKKERLLLKRFWLFIRLFTGLFKE
jgi:hypothetical protein